MTSYRTSKVNEIVKIRIGDEGISAIQPETLIHAFHQTVEKYGNENALNYGIDKNNEWKKYNWKQALEETRKFAKSVIKIGLKPFEAVNIIGFNSPEWFFADLGAIFAGCVAAGIYTTNSPSACKYICEHSNAGVILCDGVKQLEKFVSIAKDLPNLKALIIYNDPLPKSLECIVPMYTFDEFQKLGAEIPDEDLQKRMDAQEPGNCCTLIYTSGTTGNPKAVMISHDNITWTVKNIVKEFGNVDKNDRMVSYLPLSHIAAQILDIHAPIVTGMSLYFAQPDALRGSLGKTLKEVRPTIFFGVPRVWEKIMEKMKSIGNTTTGVKKMIVDWAKDKGTKKCDMNQYGQSSGAPCGYGIAHALILSKIKIALGLDKTVGCFTGAAPIGRDVLEYFASLDIPVYELFGQSECTGPECVNLPGQWKIGSCGRGLPGTTLKIIEDTNEFLYTGRNVMMGYMNNEQATVENIDDEGWLHSGDCAKIDSDGFMSIAGRIKELIITAGGENVGPVSIEDKVKEHCPAVSNCMLVGDKRKYLVILLALKVTMTEDGLPTKNLDKLCQEISSKIDSKAKTVDEVKTCPKWKEYLDKSIANANKDSTSRAQNIAKWAIVNDFTLAGGELTPTLKLKRRVVLEKYEKEIDSLYAEVVKSSESDKVASPKKDSVPKNVSNQM